MTNKIRVRYAPSPTGLLHIGNARTALFNYLSMRVIMVAILSFVLKIRTVSAMLRMGNAPSLKICVGWAWIGMKVLKRMKIIVNQNV